MKRGACWFSLAVVLAVQAGCHNVPWSSWSGPAAVKTTPVHATSSSPAPADEAGAPLVSDESRVDMMLTVGRSYEMEQKYAEAANVYQRVLQKQPRQAKACHRLAVVQDRLGRPDLAESYYVKALELMPNNAALHCDYGYSCYLRENWSAAEQHLKRAVELQPDLRRAHANLGLVWAKTGREHESLAAFANAGLSEAEARNNLGFAMTVNQQFDQAAQQYATALQLDPTLRQARLSTQEMQSVRTKLSTGGPVAPANYEEPVSAIRAAVENMPGQYTR